MRFVLVEGEGGEMKAVVEIELEIDGEWKGKQDKVTLIDRILENAGAGAWEIEEDRLIIFPRSMTCRISGKGEK